jgi:hypothetical protein
VHVTHDARLVIDDELNSDQTEWIEIASDEAIQTQDTSTIKLDVIQISDENEYVHLIEIHYYLELDTNLFSLGVLEVKELRFSINQKNLKVTDDCSNQYDKMILISHREDVVYFLNQSHSSKIVYETDLSEKSLKACNIKLVESISLEIWH